MKRKLSESPNEPNKRPCVLTPLVVQVLRNRHLMMNVLATFLTTKERLKAVRTCHATLSSWQACPEARNKWEISDARAFAAHPHEADGIECALRFLRDMRNQTFRQDWFAQYNQQQLIQNKWIDDAKDRDNWKAKKARAQILDCYLKLTAAEIDCVLEFVRRHKMGGGRQGYFYYGDRKTRDLLPSVYRLKTSRDGDGLYLQRWEEDGHAFYWGSCGLFNDIFTRTCFIVLMEKLLELVAIFKTFTPDVRYSLIGTTLFDEELDEHVANMQQMQASRL